MKVLRIISFWIIVLFLCMLTVGLRMGRFSVLDNFAAIYLTEITLIIILALLFLNYSFILRQNSKSLKVLTTDAKRNNKSNGIHLILTIHYWIGGHKGEITQMMIGELIIGRNIHIVHIAFPNNKSISEQHCRLIYEDNRMYIEPITTESITFVNDIQISEKAILNPEDSVRIGDISFQVMWQNNKTIRQE